MPERTAAMATTTIAIRAPGDRRRRGVASPASAASAGGGGAAAGRAAGAGRAAVWVWVSCAMALLPSRVRVQVLPHPLLGEAHGLEQRELREVVREEAGDVVLVRPGDRLRREDHLDVAGDAVLEAVLRLDERLLGEVDVLLRHLDRGLRGLEV